MQKLRDSLARLADRLPDYHRAVRDAGFTTCLVNEDWIEKCCDRREVELHKRYLIEIAREALSSDKPADIIYTDALNCKSPWLNELKAKRLSEHGSIDKLGEHPKTRYLEQLSPGIRELLRLKDSTKSADQKQVADQVTEFVRRREGELASHYEEINKRVRQFPAQLDEEALQTFFAQCLSQRFREWGGVQRQAMRPKGRISIVTFELSGDVVFALNPNMTVRSQKESRKLPTGRLSVAFRLMEKDTVESPTFLPERQLVVRLADLLPNEFNDYGLFEGREESCLNVLAWETALHILLPDTLRTLRAATVGS